VLFLQVLVDAFVVGTDLGFTLTNYGTASRFAFYTASATQSREAFLCAKPFCVLAGTALV